MRRAGHFAAVTALLTASVVVLATAQEPSCSGVDSKVDCGFFGIDEAGCTQRGCCWRPVTSSSSPSSRANDEPWCFFPTPSLPTYTIAASGQSPDGTLTYADLSLATAYLPALGPDSASLRLEAMAESPNRIRISIRDPSEAPPRLTLSDTGYPAPPGPQPHDPASRLFSVQVGSAGTVSSTPEPLLQIFRDKGWGSPPSPPSPPHGPTQRPLIFELLSVVYKPQYIEIKLGIKGWNATGLGETTSPSGLLLPPDPSRRHVLWTRDVGASNQGVNLYGAWPGVLFFDKEQGTGHAVSWRNSHGMEVTLSDSVLTWRCLGGDVDLVVTAGPSPSEALAQMAVGGWGDRGGMPPAFALGFQQSKWGYASLSTLAQVVSSYREAGIPLDAIWSDLDHMDGNRDFTLDPNNYPSDLLKDQIALWGKAGVRWIPIVDPGIKVDKGYPAYDSGLKEGVFVWANETCPKPYQGWVWPGPVHYPDFFYPPARKWWAKMVSDFHSLAPFSGLWIDMNEPSNFVSGYSETEPSKEGRQAGLLSQRDDAPGEEAGQGAPGRRPLSSKPLTVGGRAGGPGAAARLQPAAMGQAGPSTGGGSGGMRPDRPRPNDNAPNWEDPPYAIDNDGHRAPLGTRTIPPSAIHRLPPAASGPDWRHVPHYSLHNLYGLSEAAATFAALAGLPYTPTLVPKGKGPSSRGAGGAVADDPDPPPPPLPPAPPLAARPFILTRSTFPGAGRYAAHWSGDNSATWDSLRQSVQQVVSSAMAGLSMTGADICGYGGATEEELCARWLALGAFYPFSRDHSEHDAPPQEPFRWPKTTAAARRTLTMRLSLLPFLYSSLYLTHTQGWPAVRAPAMDYPGDFPGAYQASSTSFLLGTFHPPRPGGLLVAPVVEQGAQGRSVYLPGGKNVVWYDLWTFAPVSRGGSEVWIDADVDSIPVLIPSGSVLVRHVGPGLTVSDTRQSSISIAGFFDTPLLPAEAQAYSPFVQAELEWWTAAAASRHKAEKGLDSRRGSALDSSRPFISRPCRPLLSLTPSMSAGFFYWDDGQSMDALSDTELSGAAWPAGVSLAIVPRLPATLWAESIRGDPKGRGGSTNSNFSRVAVGCHGYVDGRADTYAFPATPRVEELVFAGLGPEWFERGGEGGAELMPPVAVIVKGVAVVEPDVQVARDSFGSRLWLRGPALASLVMEDGWAVEAVLQRHWQ